MHTALSNSGPWVSPPVRSQRPTVSCVMPAYNEARNLERVVTRVLGAVAAGAIVGSGFKGPLRES